MFLKATFILLICLVSEALFAQDYPPAVKFCNDNWPVYSLIDATIKELKKNKPEPLQPVAVEFMCHDCNEADKTAATQQKIDAWVNSIAENEEKMIAELLQMQQDWVKAGGLGKKTPNLPECYKKFSEQDFQDKVSFLRDHIFLDKILPMARKWKNSAASFLAGSNAIVKMAHYATENSRFDEYEEAKQLLLDWTKTYCDRIENAVTRSYQYRLYAALLFDAKNTMLGGADIGSSAYIRKTIDKLNDFMHFNMKIEFEASGHGDNGGKYHALVNGEGKVKCSIDGDCVVWEPEEAEGINFTIKEVIFKSDEGTATYNGPPQFQAPVTIKSSMCGDDPTIKIAFEKFGPANETYVAKGQEFQSPLLYGLAMATLGSVNLDRMKNEAGNLQKKAESFKGKEAEVDAAAKRLNAHKNDPNYLKSPQGKADMSMMQQMSKDLGYGGMKAPDPKRMKNLEHLKAMNEAQQKINAKFRVPGYIGSAEYQADKAQMAKLKENVDMNDLTNAVGFDMNIMMIQAPLQNGSQKAVDKLQKDKIKSIAGSSSGWEFGQFHVILEQAG
ncbi:MAG: hypothetical protein ACJ749_18805, partial [Flavisolibacter sp.]